MDGRLAVMTEDAESLQDIGSVAGASAFDGEQDQGWQSAESGGTVELGSRAWPNRRRDADARR